MPSGRFNKLSPTDQCLVANVAKALAPTLGSNNPLVKGNGSATENLQEFIAAPQHLDQLKTDVKKDPGLAAAFRAQCLPAIS